MLRNSEKIRQLRDQFVDRTNGFKLNDAIVTALPFEDNLLQSIRRFYLLLPKAGISLAWASQLKPKRRSIIQRHLESVCQSVSQENIREVDRWLTCRISAREDLKYYGRTLEETYGKLCFICGKKIKDYATVDHIFPFSKGGATELENLILAHRDCNSSKGAYHPGEMMRWAPDDYSAGPSEVDQRLKYLVFLRDNFTCQQPECGNGLFSAHEIAITLRHSTGISCYDNLKTVCINCGPLDNE